jgi:hypothetical protein
MRISHCQGEHLIVLHEQEAARLMDACALVVLAAESDPRASLPPEMATVLCELFEGLRQAAEAPASQQPN